MKKGFIGIFFLFGIAFLAITLLKQSSESAPKTEEARDNTTAATDRDRSRTEVIDFWDAYNRATDLRTAGDFDRALTFYQEALSIDPHHQNSLYYQGNLMLRSGKFEEAEKSWKRLKQVNPSSARAYSQLGTLYSCRDSSNPLYNLDRAADHFAEAARLNREETGPLLQLAKIDLINGNYGRAREKLDDVISSNFRSVEALFLKGFLLWKSGDSRAANSLFQRSLSIVEGTSAAKNVGEGDTEQGGSPLWADFSRCDLYSGRIYSLLVQTELDEVQPKAAYQTFGEELD